MIRLSTFVLLAVTAALAAPAMAHKEHHKNIELTHPWVRAVPKGATLTAGYVKITNTGQEEDRLVGASLTGAGTAELYVTAEEGGVSQMRPVKEGVEIPAGGTVKLETGGAHIMFLDLAKPLDEETYVPGTLTFEKAGKMDMEFFVEPLDGDGQAGPAPAGAAREHH
jgi:copper(I)-binding protein